mgnify:CR=1 FL=1
MQIIEILVRPNGETQLLIKGFTGNQCREASAFLERALGERASEQLTTEFYQPTSTEQVAREGQA